jgi:hypothetical protein
MYVYICCVYVSRLYPVYTHPTCTHRTCFKVFRSDQKISQVGLGGTGTIALHIYYIYRYRYSCVQVYTRVQLPHAREKIVTLRKKWKIYKKRNPKFDTWMAAQKARTATGQWYAEMRRKMGIRGRGRVPVRDAGQVGGGRGRDDRGSHQLVTSSVRSVATCICTLYLFVFLGVFAGEFMFMSS